MQIAIIRAMNELLTRAVEEVVPMKVAEAKLATGKPMRIYLGIDPTGAKLHLGHSVPLRKLRAFQDAGHKVIFLVGSFTAMIGDPSGRDTQREPLTREQIQKNFEDYKRQAALILDWNKVELRYNHEWLEKMNFEDVLKLTSMFTKQQLEQRDMFQRREKEGNPIHMHEMLYPMMQGYDSVALDVDAEIGGNDQLFNMLAGRTLMKLVKNKEKFVLTTKLIEGTDGRKMSKTYDNCIYLTDEPKDMYGKTMRILDNLIPLYMECCTSIPMDEIRKVEKALADGSKNPKEMKMALARKLVGMYHGEEAAKHAEEQFQSVFKDGGTPDDMAEAKVKAGTLLVDVLLEHKLVPSKSEFRRLVEQKGIHVNDKTVTALDAKAEKGVVRVGKRKFLRIL
jgi:tyrosyl-tRNA synthetase